MEELKTFFFDTYAFYEIIEGNPNYKKYEKGIGIITTKLNLMELHYGLLRLHGKKLAESQYNLFLEFAIEFNDEVIKEANKFKLLHKKKRLSYVDCIGYILAKKRNIKFLTGDEGFKNLDNVEFVK